MSTFEQFPQTGDQVRAVHRMRAWENDRERGINGTWVEAGQVALVLLVWRINGKTRMKLLVNDRIAMFSSRTHDVAQNWHVVSRQLPPSGSL